VLPESQSHGALCSSPVGGSNAPKPTSREEGGEKEAFVYSFPPASVASFSRI